MQNFVSLIFIRPWFPALSLGDCFVNECASNDRVVCDFGYPAFSLAFYTAQLILKNLMRLTIDKQMKMQYILTELSIESSRRI